MTKEGCPHLQWVPERSPVTNTILWYRCANCRALRPA